MEARRYLDVLSVVGRLKDTTRHCYTAKGRHESVAEHSFRAALMAYFLKDEFPEADMDKVIKMCLLHDLGEAFTGDIPAFEKSEGDGQREEALLEAWIGGFPAPQGPELLALLREMDALETPEARIYKALDNLEAVIQHDEADIATWLPLEYELQLTYGAERVKAAPSLQRLKAEIDERTRRKIEEAAAGKAK